MNVCYKRIGDSLRIAYAVHIDGDKDEVIRKALVLEGRPIQELATPGDPYIAQYMEFLIYSTPYAILGDNSQFNVFVHKSGEAYVQMISRDKDKFDDLESVIGSMLIHRKLAEQGLKPIEKEKLPNWLC